MRLVAFWQQKVMETKQEVKTAIAAKEDTVNKLQKAQEECEKAIQEASWASQKHEEAQELLKVCLRNMARAELEEVARVRTAATYKYMAAGCAAASATMTWGMMAPPLLAGKGKGKQLEEKHEDAAPGWLATTAKSSVPRPAIVVIPPPQAGNGKGKGKKCGGNFPIIRVRSRSVYRARAAATILAAPGNQGTATVAGHTLQDLTERLTVENTAKPIVTRNSDVSALDPPAWC